MLLRVSAVFSPYLSLKYITYFFSVCLISPCSLPAAVCRLRASLRLSSDPPARCVFRGCCASPAVFCCVPRPRALIRPLCAPLKLSGGLLRVLSCVSCLSVTRQPSGARRCGSVGRCTAYMSPALPPLAYVLPWLVPWLVLPAACCRLVVTIACMPLYPGRRLCGAASAM